MAVFKVYCKNLNQARDPLDRLRSVRVIKDGVRPMNIFFPVAVYGFFKKSLYLLGLLYLALVLISAAIDIPAVAHIVWIVAVLFSSDLESFFLSLKGYRFSGVVVAGSESDAMFEVCSRLGAMRG